MDVIKGEAHLGSPNERMLGNVDKLELEGNFELELEHRDFLLELGPIG